MTLNEYRDLILESELRSSSKLVAFILCQYFNQKTLECYPSIRTLEKTSCLSDKTIQSSLQELKDKSFISIEKKKAKNSNFNLNYYTLIGVTVVNQTTLNTTSITTLDTTVKNEDSTVVVDVVVDVVPTVVGTVVNQTTELSKPLYLKNNKEKNNKKESIAPTEKKYDPLQTLLDLNVDVQIAKDWITHRKLKKATITQTVILQHQKEAQKASFSLDSALEMSCLRGWVGFKAEWCLKAENQPQNGFPSQKRLAEGKYAGMSEWEIDQRKKRELSEQIDANYEFWQEQAARDASMTIDEAFSEPKLKSIN